MAFGLRKKRDLEVRMYKRAVIDMVSELKDRFRRVAQLYLLWKDNKEMRSF